MTSSSISKASECKDIFEYHGVTLLHNHNYAHMPQSENFSEEDNFSHTVKDELTWDEVSRRKTRLEN